MPAYLAHTSALAAIPETAASESNASAQSQRIAFTEAVLTVCAFCYGTVMEVVPGEGARRCRCRNGDGTAKLMDAALISGRYSECSLQSYKPATGNSIQLRAFNYAFRLLREYPCVDRGLLLMGTCGAGKTHLSVAILCGLIERGYHAASMNSARS